MGMFSLKISMKHAPKDKYLTSMAEKIKKNKNCIGLGGKIFKKSTNKWDEPENKKNLTLSTHSLSTSHKKFHSKKTTL
jgi:hypothetical protein